MEHAHAKRLSWIAAIVVSACLCLAAWLISGWINRFGNDAMLTDVVLLPCSASQKVKVWENGVIYSDGTSLHALDGSGRQKWTYPVGTGLDFAVGDQTVAAWSGSTLALLDSKSGASLLTTTMSDPVLSACAGPTYAAVLTGEEHNATLNVLDLNGRQVDSISLASLTVLDFDFFSEGSMLWVMLLNTEGSQTMSMVSTYRPGRVQSGSITDTQQLVYHVSFTANSVQTVGTSYLKTYDYTGVEQTDQRKLLYGWTMLAADSSASSPLMFFAPENEVSTAATMRSMPPIHAMLISPVTIWVLMATGSHQRSIGMALIWAMVLILPNQFTLTAPDSPILAIHSRSADTVISRPMMIIAISMSQRSSPTSATSAADTRSLSATGSRKAPMRVAQPW